MWQVCRTQQRKTNIKLHSLFHAVINSRLTFNTTTTVDKTDTTGLFIEIPLEAPPTQTINHALHRVDRFRNGTDTTDTSQTLQREINSLQAADPE